MWAQLIKMKLKPGKEDELAGMFGTLSSFEQPGSGLVRTTCFQDQKDPSQAYVVVLFESEEKARIREKDPRRAEGLQEMQAVMADLFTGPMEFTDLTVVGEVTP
jgi:heme-degrading monooxygenase HmoA